ncbi:MAG: sorbosone dehydrogenase family protein [Burkholderiaceae bacterium]
MTRIRLATLLVVALIGASCAEPARSPVSIGVGPNPQLPEPHTPLIPTVHIAPAVGWPAGVTPTAAAGLRVTALATGLEHPRSIYVLPNGDVLVAETNAPSRPEHSGLYFWIMGKVQARAGAGTPTANRITLLRDADGDGIAEVQSVFLEGLNSPFGMALVGDQLYVANTDAVMRFPYVAGATRIKAPGTRVADLPAGPFNHHWTKNLIASRDGSKLYASVGSNSNVGENGLAKEEGRAAIYEIDLAANTHRLMASGMRNPTAMAWESTTGVLWTVVNERDDLGHNLVPDYLTSVREGGFYGWPWSYYGRNVDPRAEPKRPDMVAKALVPDYALGSHVAPLGLAASDGNALPAQFARGMFVGEHGSWNRKPRSGYAVVFVPFAAGRPSGTPIDVLTGFVNAEGKAYGRPVGVAIDRRGALLVADDVGNVIWRVTSAGDK